MRWIDVDMECRYLASLERDLFGSVWEWNENIITPTLFRLQTKARSRLQYIFIVRISIEAAAV